MDQGQRKKSSTLMKDVYGVKLSREFVSDFGIALNDVIQKNAAETDRSASFPDKSIQALREIGVLGLCVAKERGGLGYGPAEFASVTERIAEACGSTAMIFVMHVSAAQTFSASTTLAGRDDLLREVAQGKHLTTLAFSEKGSRSHFWAPVSKLASNSNGSLKTTASKSWITSAKRADSYVASGQMPGANSPMESTLYLVHSKSKGIRKVSAFDGLGLRGNDSAPVEFDELDIPQANLLTTHGAGAPMMMEVVLPWFCVGTAAMAHGLCRAAISGTQQHLTNSKFEHLGSALRDLPNLRARLAQMSMQTEQSRALLGQTIDRMATPDETTPLFVLQSRMSALQAAVDVTDLAMKTCGGAAFSKHLGIERIFRDARAGWVMAPTVDHLQDFVGRALTGLPLF